MLELEMLSLHGVVQLLLGALYILTGAIWRFTLEHENLSLEIWRIDLDH
jgi:hypothetical protein